MGSPRDRETSAVAPALFDSGLHFQIQRPDSAYHHHTVRDDVAAETPMDGRDGDDGRSLRDVGLAAHYGLESQHHLRGGDHRIHATPRHRSMGLFPTDGDAEGLRGSHCPPSPVPDYTRGLGPNVEAKNCVWARVLQGTFLDHEGCPPTFPFRSPRFGRVKNQ